LAWQSEKLWKNLKICFMIKGQQSAAECLFEGFGYAEKKQKPKK
jgi:hypothetical protein